jgi:VCBS repeat-containing protein
MSFSKAANQSSDLHFADTSVKSAFDLTAPKTSALLFIDARLDDAQSLAAAATAGTEVHLLRSPDAMAEITQTLLGRSGIESLQIVSHGKSGGLRLGESWLDAQNLPGYVGALKSWGAALSENADILLYGCNVGQNPAGAGFVSLLAEVTGADVAASDDVTGAGGDWDLEVRSGRIETIIGITHQALQAYRGQLNLVEDTSITLPAVLDGSVAWGDYSGDGKLDLIVTGSGVSKLYKNNGGGLAEDTSILLPGVSRSAVAWGDYNGDGKLDLALTGENGGIGLTKIYQNDGNGGLVEDTAIALPGVTDSAVAWGDYSGDGKADLILTGSNNGLLISKLYKSNAIGGLTEDTTVTLPGIQFGSVAWGDYSGDNKLDLVFSGNGISRLYKNDGNGLLVQDTVNLLTDLRFSSAAWGDYSGDGKQDLIVSGYYTGGAASGASTKRYKNDGLGGVVADAPYPESVSKGSVAWGDYNGDGKLDLIVAGESPTGIIAKLYKNDGNGGLIEDTSVNLPGVRNASVAWGDYNGDGKADLVLTGEGASGAMSKLYKFVTVTAPVLDPTATPVMGALDEDAAAPVGAVGSLVSALVDLKSVPGGLDNVTDLDDGALTGIAITATDTTNGTWSYSLDGTTWTAVGAVSATNALLLAANARLYFKPNLNYNGTIANAITFRAWDRITGTNGGSADTTVNGNATAFSTATDTAGITINSVNDAPINTAIATANINEDIVLTLTGISVNDVDGDLAATQLTVTNGKLKVTLSGAATITNGSNDSTSLTLSGSQADINATLASLTYQGALNFNGSDILTISSADSAGVPLSDVDTVAITVNSINDLPAISGDAIGSVTEDASSPDLVASGSLTVVDTDTNESSFIARTNVAGAYGSFSIDNAGVWSYKASNANPAIQNLSRNRAWTETFAVRTADGTLQNIVITINGANDLATITGTFSGSVTENTAPLLTTSGLLGITDSDAGEINTFLTQTTQGTYGVFSLLATGAWDYAADNAATAIQSLAAGQTITDTFTVAVDEPGAITQTITITLNGVNEAATIAGVLSGTVVEDSSNPTLTKTGQLTVTDPDTGEAAFQVQSTPGTYGTFSLDATGLWTYSADNTATAIQTLGSTGVLTETFVVKSIDGTSQVVTVLIAGKNDAAVITGPSSGTLAESSTTPLTGNLDFTDIDNPADVWTVGSGNSTYGSFTVDVAGVWTYSLNTTNATVKGLNTGATLTDTFKVKTNDGTAQVVTITITGENNPAVITGNTTGAVIENSPTAITGNLDFTDVDNPGDIWAVASGNGTYGAFTVDAAGVWSYSLDNANPTVDALNPGGSLSDSFTLTTNDGTTQTVTIAITGLNDPAIIAGIPTGSIVENTTTAITGNLDFTDVDNPSDTWAITANNATYGAFAVDATGGWRYSLDNANPTVNALTASGTLFDTFVMTTNDGTTQTVTIAITGVNDAAIITGATAGIIAENTTTAITGNLDFTDVDNPADVWTPNSAGTATYGGFSVDAAGVWTYTLDNANTIVDALNVGGSLTDTFTLVTNDGTSQIVTVTINGTNDAPVITGTKSGSIVENTTTAITGNLDFTDVDNPVDGWAVSTGNSTYGAFSVDATGTWSYTLDNANPTLNALTGSESLSDSFTLATLDGTTQLVTIAITGANDLPTIGGAIVGSVTEDATTPNLTSTGSLTISDVDAGESFFQGQAAITGTYGKLSIGTTGAWTFTADNANPAIQALGTGDTLSDVFTVRTVDDTAQTVTITINGANDAATIAGTIAGTIVEDTSLTATGALTITDIDAGETSSFIVQNTPGTYGSFAIDTAGVWTYSANNTNPAVQGLGTGDSLTETFTVAILDGATQVITITLNGSNDAPVIAGALTGAIAEDATTPTLTVNGALTITDADAGESSFLAQTAVAGTYGSFSIDTAGLWTYSADNTTTAIQSLGNGDSRTEIFTVKTADNTAQTVTITINGTNDDPTIGGVISGTIVEDATTPILTATGALTVTDVDTNQASFQTQSATPGTYGAFSVTATGVWTYEANNNQPAIQSLKSGDSLTETFTVKTADNKAQTITIAINGANDAATIAGAITGSVTEDATTPNLTTGGSLTVSDPDTGESSFQAQTAAGTYGSFTIDTAGVWTYSASNAQASIQGITTGQTLTDSFTVKTADGTSQAVTITINGTNDVAVITGDLTGTATEDDTIAIAGNLDVTDSDNPIDAWKAVSGDASYGKFSVDASGQWSYKLDQTLLVVQALNTGGQLTDAFSLFSEDGTLQTVTIAITGINDAPTIVGLPPATIAEGQPFTFIPTAADVDNSDLTFTIVNQPTWATFDPLTGRLSGTPMDRSIDSTSGIVISVSDGAFTSDLAAFDLTVVLPNTPVQGYLAVAGGNAIGQQLTVNNFLTDVDGGITSTVYQWQESTDGTNWTNIANANGGTFQLTIAQTGKQVRIQATVIDGQNNSETLFSAPTTAIQGVGLNTNLNITAGVNTQTVVNWGTNLTQPGFTPGLTYVVTVDRPALFDQLPTLSADGTLSYAPKAYSNINALVNLTVQVKRPDGTIDPAFTRSSVLTIEYKPEALIRNSSTNEVGLLYIDRVTQLQAQRTLTDTTGQTVKLTPDWAISDTADFNRDGIADILLHNKMGDEVSIAMMGRDGQVLRMQSLMQNGQVLRTQNTNWKVAGFADIDRDNILDVVFYNQQSDEIGFWFMNADGVNVRSYDYLRDGSGAIVKTKNPLWELKAVADFDGDGDSDLLLRLPSLNQTAIVQLDGKAMLSYQFIANPPQANLEFRGVGDANGDRSTDIYWQTADNQKIVIQTVKFQAGQWLADSFTESSSTAKLEGVGDLDRNGTDDLLLLNLQTKSLSVAVVEANGPQQSVDVQTQQGQQFAFNSDWQIVQTDEFGDL